MTKAAAGLLLGMSEHHLDHLGPLCSLLDIPLVIVEEEIALLAKKYYPQTTIIKTDYLRLPEQLVASWEAIFCCIPRHDFDQLFFFAQHFFNKRLHTVWVPHGNSDKGNHSFFMEALNKEEMALLYGKKMVDFLKRKQVFDQLKSFVLTGNFRHLYYSQHKHFYDPSLKKERKRTILYAPTWIDEEKGSSFFEACPSLIDNLPPDYQLLIKLHPNIPLQDRLRTEALMAAYEGREGVRFLLHFPPIYPLLEIADIYIGDTSSIGYDFLFYNKPMFFLNQTGRNPHSDLSLFLFRCGVEIKPNDYSRIYSIIEQELPSDQQRFYALRKEIYDYTFGKQKPQETLKTEIFTALESLPEQDLM